MKEHDIVMLTAPLAIHKLPAGTVGTIVHMTAGFDTCIVEFTSRDGNTLAVTQARFADLRLADDLDRRESPARQVA